jgi:DNA invertase Pin-like site-specific DNA recombinase
MPPYFDCWRVAVSGKTKKKDADAGKPWAVLYARVSKLDRKEDASTLTQEAACRAKAERDGFYVPPEWCFRESFSGFESLSERPKLAEFRAAAADPRVKAAYCYVPDRLARDTADLLTVVRGLRKDGAEPKFAQIDLLPGIQGEVQLITYGLGGTLEWANIKERADRGRNTIYGAGKWLGTGRVRYGYVWDKKTRTRSAHPVHADIVRRIFEEAAAEMSPRSIAARLNAEGIAPPFRKRWVEDNVRRIIRCVTYKGVCVGRSTQATGRRRPNGSYIQVARPVEERAVLQDARTDALVSPELWAKANALVSSRRSGGRSGWNKHDFLLNGHLFCGKEDCGHRMGGVLVKRPNRPNAQRLYRCSGYLQGYAKCTGCRSNLGSKWLEERAIALLSEALLEPGRFERELERVRAGATDAHARRDLELAEAEAKTLAREKGNLVEILARGGVGTLDAAMRDKIASLTERESYCETALIRARSALEQLARAEEIIQDTLGRLGSLRKRVRAGGMTTANWRDAFAALDVRVYAVPGRCWLDVGVRSDSGAITRSRALRASARSR